MNTFTTILNLLLASIVMLTSVAAQEVPQWNNMLDPYTEPAEVYDSLDCFAGGYVGINTNSHQGALTLIDNGTVCCQTKEGSGTGAHSGAVMYYPLTSWLYVSPRVGIEGRGGVLLTDEITKEIRGQGNQIQTATVQRDMNVYLTTLNTDVQLCIALFRKPFVYVGVGPSVGLALQSDFTARENIISPSGMTYINSGETTTELYNGSIQSLRYPTIALRTVAGIAFLIGKGVYMNPEIGYHIPFTTNTTLASENWTTNMLLARMILLWRWKQ